MIMFYALANSRPANSWRVVFTVLLSLLLVLSLAACSTTKEEPTPEPETTTVTVSGPAGEVPTIEFDEPFEFVSPVTEVLWEGSGEKVQEGDWVMLHMYALNPETGDEIRNDYTGLPQAYVFSPKTIGSELYNSLVELPFGSRIMHVSQDKDVTQILVVDMLPARSVADPRPVDKALPEVSYEENGKPIVSVGKKLTKPHELVVQHLKSGSGLQVDEKAQVLVHIAATTWSDSKEFYSTWEKDAGPIRFKVGVDKVIAGLDQALVGVPVGSQIMVIIPPELGFGQTNSDLAKETLVYVVDVLAATTVPEK